MEQDNLKKSLGIALDSVDGLIDQCYQAWQESHNVHFDKKYEKIENIVVCGMGGSSLPAHIISSVFNIKVPIYICETYTVPLWTGKNTLVILSSYSGNTEETLSCGAQAKERGCLIAGITSGGKLREFLDELHVPFYHFNPKFNPSKLPRFGIGYGIFGQLGLLSNLNLINDYSGEQLDLQLADSIKHLTLCFDSIVNSAQEFVNKANGDILVLFSSEHLKGNGHTFTNQINETSKTLSFCAELPEADHNLIEGLKKSQTGIIVLFIESQNYPVRILERFDITREIINEDGYKSYVYKVNKGSLMQEMLEVLLFSSFSSVKLAEYNNTDPLAIPSIDYIKSKLSLTELK